jgi:E3 ubiquitin-protein ligase listerin
MPKNTRSSASSATRKKHARKTGGLQVEIVKENPSKKKGRAKDVEPPKRKAFIPPVKPTPQRIDPLDSMGLAASLDKDLVVMLRKLAKKDTITKTRGLEELKEWAQKSPDDSLISILPVWVRVPHALELAHWD